MSNTFGVMTHLNIVICEDGQDATDKGHFYTRETHTAVNIERAVVVRNGTDGGKPTVDFVLVDETGKKYVVMITGALLKGLPL